MPAGPGHIGEINAVAMSPDGSIEATGGYLEGHAIYLLDQHTGKMTRRIGGLPNVVHGLAVSANGPVAPADCASSIGTRIGRKHSVTRPMAVTAMAQPSPMTDDWTHRLSTEKSGSMTRSSWSPPSRR
jgi:hypothetical protein